MQSLAFSYGTLVEAQNSLPPNTQVGLAELIQRHDKLAEAWHRGQFLRNLRNLASVPVSLDEAAKRLNLNGPDDLRRILETDAEAGDLWRQSRHDAFIKIKVALTRTALEGNQTAIRAVENLLHAEMNHRTAPKLTITDIANVTGRSRHLVYNWTQRNNLPLGLDKTIELKNFIRWFEAFTAEDAIAKNGGKGNKESRLHAMKADVIEIELRRRRNDLLDRDEVMAGIVARHQVLINSMRHKAPQIAQLCQGQQPERVIKIITDALGDICRELCQVPAQLCLPEPAAKAYQNVLEMLNDGFGKNDH